MKLAFAADMESSEKTAFRCIGGDGRVRLLERIAFGQPDHVWTVERS